MSRSAAREPRSEPVSPRPDTVDIADILTDHAYGVPIARPKLAGARTVLGVPMLKEEEPSVLSLSTVRRSARSTKSKSSW